MYLQFFEELSVRHWMISGEISCYSRHVDDILIIFDQNKSNEVSIANHMYNILKYLEFKLK